VHDKLIIPSECRKSEKQTEFDQNRARIPETITADWS